MIQRKPNCEDTDLGEEEKGNMRRLNVLERDVACPIGFVSFSIADMSQALGNVGNDGRLDLDSLR